MKKFKLILFSVLLLVMMLPNRVFAADTGSIKIDNPVKDETYKLYKIADLYSYDGDAYLYTIEEDNPFYSYLTGSEGKQYMTVEDRWDELNSRTIHVINWVKGASVSDFTAAIKNYIKNNKIEALKTVVSDGTEISFTDLPLGYYLVDSSVGALCGLDTTDPDVIIHEKNFVPSVEKQVMNNGLPEKSNTASIGDELDFVVVITAFAGAQNYILYDEASAGITFDENSLDSVSIDDTYVLNSNYVYTLDDAQHFHIEFKQSFLDGIEGETEITVRYKGKLNEKAVIGDGGNSNTAYLQYGTDSKTENSVTRTYTYEFQIVKTDASEKVISGATFNLYKGGTLLSFIKEGNNYRLAMPNEQGATSTIEASIATIQGLGNGTYGLVEVSAPAGYTPIDYSVNVTINNANNDATVIDNIYQGQGIQVINRTGGILPNTGGSGTAVMVVAGVIFVLAAIVLIRSTKKEK